MMMLRSAVFYLGYSAITVGWGSFSVLVGWLLPYRLRFQFIVGAWTRMCLYWLRLTCGIRHEIHGLENIPAEPCVVLCRHESTWETLFLQTVFAPQATITKRELLWIPFFGWAFALLRPIAIDRSSPRNALRRLIRTGSARLAAGIWVVLFPEGTRMPAGELGRFRAGGAALASAAHVPVLVVAHNAGRHWPPRVMVKTPGTIQVRIMTPIRTDGRDAKAVTAEARDLMAEAMAMLPAA